MRLLINTAMLRFGGAVQVALSFISECRQFKDHEYHVVLGPGVGAVINLAEFPDNFRFYPTAFGVMKPHKLVRIQREMAVIERQVRPDCVVTTSGPAFWKSRAPHLMGFNRPLDIYLDSPYLQSLRGLRRVRRTVYRHLHGWFYRREADAFIVQTDDVNRRARSWLRTEAVYTVTNTHGAFYANPGVFPPRLPPKKEGVFRFVTVTSYYRHKNLELIPVVLQQLASQGINSVEFVLTLTPEEYHAHIGAQIPEGVVLVGSVPPMQCPSLYDECDGMFLPTLAECFSASYPEAMVMRKPIVTTDLGFARSICGPAALYFKPCDAVDSARAISDLIGDKKLRETLCAEGMQRLECFDSSSQRAIKILEICWVLAGKKK